MAIILTSLIRSKEGDDQVRHVSQCMHDGKDYCNVLSARGNGYISVGWTRVTILKEKCIISYIV